MTVRRSPHLILASGSPRRRELLVEAGYEFEVIPPTVPEVSEQWLTIREATVWNALRKATEVARAKPDAVVLGADTLVILDGLMIGKPADYADAARILKRLSGRVHEVWTAVYIYHFATGRAHHFQEMSQVRFRRLTDEAITDYFGKVNPLDKA